MPREIREQLARRWAQVEQRQWEEAAELRALHEQILVEHIILLECAAAGVDIYSEVCSFI
jgi:hypothetical protein